MPPDRTSPNFDFLGEHDEQLVRIAALAERYFQDDPNTCLIKLRQFAELLAQQLAARTGLFASAEESQSDLLRRLKLERAAPGQVFDLFHQLHRAAHDHTGEHAQALTRLKVARQLGIWFHRTFTQAPKLSPGPFVPPPDPEAVTARLLQALAETQSAEARARLVAEQRGRDRESAGQRADREVQERLIREQLAHEAEQAENSCAAQLAALQRTAEQAPVQEKRALLEYSEAAAKAIDLDEAATRDIIDQQLRACRWEADTENLRHANGSRPAKGRAIAIAEWPTDNGPSDYALFVGTECIGVVEAKRQRKNVSAAIDQAERYARDIRLDQGSETAGGPWGAYRVPFTFSTNGRPYLKQLETESGIWFRDVRYDTNHRRALAGWFTPDGLKAKLEVDHQAAHEALKTQPFDFGFLLRPYQKTAIEKVEEALGNGSREMLVAMATGTGKTKLAIALLYRLLTVKRFRRVCFVVDRKALATQTGGEFSTTKVVGPKTFADIFDLKGIKETVPHPETKVHISTIQGLVRRVLYASEPDNVPPIDRYDLIVVDECHRGYLLDREMSDAELSFRSQEDYISKYRRVLEHFDAVKIGLTATPALHTVQIFGDLVFTYSYREAVIDGYLIDHEPPVRIETALSQSGITFKTGEQMELLDSRTGRIDLTHAPDEINFQVDEFNKKVVTVPFNRAVAGWLAHHIDPALPGKTLVFAVSNAHADIIVVQLKHALADRYGEIEDDAVRKITGSVDKVDQLIRSYRNDAFPKIAVTVDLLTTGIDVPSITNLVFFRRVNSRILYEQMLGRATRRCDDIGKEAFRIFDAVDLYPHLQDLTDMKPVVANPAITLDQLFEELARVEDEEHRREVRDQILVKMRRRLRRLSEEARQHYEATAGETPEATLERLDTAPVEESAAWSQQRPGIGRILDWDPNGSAPPVMPISHHPDEVVAVGRGYGDAEKPEDFLDSFTGYIRNNVNRIAALNVVVQRPRELTRTQLRKLHLELDRRGYSETNLRRAWHDARNEDIAASIIGFVRQAAIGDPLMPYEERVAEAMKRILAKRAWTEPQRQWLKHIAAQIAREVIVDHEALDHEPFRGEGGFSRLNRVFDGQLEALLSDFNEELWRKTA